VAEEVAVDSLLELALAPVVARKFAASSIPIVASSRCDYPEEVLGELECRWVAAHDEIP